MRFEYDPEGDAAYLQLQEAQIARSKQVDASVALDFDKDGGLVGVEVFSVSKRGSGMKPASDVSAQTSQNGHPVAAG